MKLTVPDGVDASTPCRITLTLSARVRIHRAGSGTVTARTVLIGSETVTIAAGGSQPVTLPLNGVGRRLLARRHRLTATLAVTASGRTVSSSTVTLTRKR